jgi:hypothetical protein
MIEFQAENSGGGKMPPLFWSGKLSCPVKIMMHHNCIFAWINGSTGDTNSMKERIKSDYDGLITDNVNLHDDLGMDFQIKAAKFQLKGVHVMDSFPGSIYIDNCNMHNKNFITDDMIIARWEKNNG